MKTRKIKLSKNMLVRDWLKIWYETYAVPFVKESTQVSYECYIRRHINPIIGNLKLSDLNAITLQDFFNQQYTSGSAAGTSLAPKTIINMRMMLHEALGDAMKNDLIACNYVEAVKLPKNTRKEMRVLDNAEQARLVATLKASDDRFAFGIFLCLATGIRLGELCGLQWDDITITDSISTLRIARTVGRIPDLQTGQGTKLHISSPKSDAANRIIPLNDIILKHLKHYRMQLCAALGEQYGTGSNYIMSCKAGKPVEPKYMQVKFKSFLQASDIKDANFHALRHTFATRALEKNVDFKTLSAILGHANVTTTMNLYQHVLLEQKKSAMDKILTNM